MDSQYVSQPEPKRRKLSKKTKQKFSSKLYKAPWFKGDTVHTFERTFRLPATGGNNFTPNQALTDAAGVQATWRVQPQLGDLPQYTEFSSLYDEYRILECSVKVEPRYETNVTTSNDSYLLILGWFNDHNGAAAATYDIAENPWLERRGYKQIIMDKAAVVKFSPRPLQGSVLGTVAGTATYGRAPWLSTGDSSVPHYGGAFRLYAPHATASFTSPMCAVYVTLKFQCRQSR
jgi:hypothetical protein